MPTLRRAGHSSGIVGKARAALSHFLEETGNTRAPYYPADPEMVQSLKVSFRTFWADELRSETVQPGPGLGRERRDESREDDRRERD